MANQRPVIGIILSPPEDEAGQYNLNPAYSDAIWQAGGTPLAIPLMPEPQFVDQVIEQLDGLVLSGAMYDLDPERYGESKHEKLGHISADRDNTDAMFIARAESRKMPLLGICHGAQAINVARGGTIVQDIVSEFGTEINHRTQSKVGEYAHEVIFEPDSVFNHTDEKFVAKTNSAHHQSINRVGDGLKVIACTADGVLEAVENVDMNDHFVLGVQWHPERLSRNDELSFRAFEGLISAATQ